MANPVYLDNNATTKMRPVVIESMARAMAFAGNPSSVHSAGRMARQMVETAREKIAEFSGCQPNQIIFTSGGSESNNWALTHGGRKRVLISAVEHDSVRAATSLAETIPVDANGVVKLDVLDKMLSMAGDNALVSVMLANNETGALQPAAEIAAICKKYGALFHVDAVQAFGKIRFDFSAIGCDMMTISAHKCGGPKGIGALIFSDSVPLAAMIKGGGQERSRRAGTENFPAICGFGALTDQLRETMDIEIARMNMMRDDMESRLAVVPGIEIVARQTARLPNTTCLIRNNMSSEIQLMKMDMAGFCISSGAACSSGKVRPSHVLLAMGWPADKTATAIRISTGWDTSADDVARFCAVYAGLGEKSQNTISALKNVTMIAA